jgi:hypothetical protein
MPMPLEPNPECSGSGSRSGDTLSAGTFSGQFPPSGVKFLNAGIYCVSGDFRLNGGDSLTSLGSGVVIRMDSGNVVWNGGAVINLYAPTTGPFKGLLLFMPCNNPDQNISLNGSSSSTIKGSIVGMCADASWEGNNGTVLNGQLVGYTVTINGTSNNTITYDNQYNFDATYPPQIELNK